MEALRVQCFPQKVYSTVTKHRKATLGLLYCVMRLSTGPYSGKNRVEKGVVSRRLKGVNLTWRRSAGGSERPIFHQKVYFTVTRHRRATLGLSY